MELELTIPRQHFRVTVANYADASKKYRAYIADREEEGMGGARMNDKGLLIQFGQVVAHVSYNGCVWEGEHYVAGATPSYDPAQEQRAAAIQKGATNYAEKARKTRAAEKKVKDAAPKLLKALRGLMDYTGGWDETGEHPCAVAAQLLKDLES